MADFNIHQLHFSNQVREAEEQRAAQRKKNILILILQYLEEQGYLLTAENLRSETSMKLDQYVVCDNIGLELILQEFETFHYVKFRRQPQIVKKLQEDRKVYINEKRKNGSKSKSMISKYTKSTYSSGSSYISSASNSMRLQRDSEFSNCNASTLPKIGEVEDKNGCGEIIVEGSGIAPPPPSFLKKMPLEIASPDMGDNRLLRPLASFSNYNNDWRALAEVISSEIYTENPNVQWDQIVGHARAKKILKEAVIYPIKYPELFASVLSPWRGLLLYGPTGTGKTLLAKALATECRTTFFNICSSTIVSKWRGDSEKLIKVLFDLARHHAPSTIFLDEVDSLMFHRGSQGGSEHEASRRMKAELLAQMDGLASSDDLVFVLAASNLPWELDYAMLRRLEKRILIPLPSEEERAAMFKQFLPPVIQKTTYVNLLSDLDYEELAKVTEGYTGADIKLVCKEAKMNCLRRVFDLLEHVDKDNSLVNEVTIDPIKTSDVLEAISSTKPSSGSLTEKYEGWHKECGSS